MIVLEHEGERSEEEVQDAQKNGREYAQIQAHGLEEEELEGPDTAPRNGPKHRLVHLFDGCSPGRVARVLSELDGFSAEKYRVIGFWH